MAFAKRKEKPDLFAVLDEHPSKVQFSGMLRFHKDRWLGNGWPSIEFTPEDARYFPRVLMHLVMAYEVEYPAIVDTIDGYACDIVLLDSPATLSIDTWTFSLGVAQETVRDRVWKDLAELPPDYFGDLSSSGGAK